MKLNKIAIIFTILSIATLPFFHKIAESHSAGPSIEKEIDGYLVDIGYSSDPIVENEQVRFEFELLKADSSVNFSGVWVRISDGPKTIFAGNLGRPPLGPVGMTTTIPEAGDYTLSARYVNNQGDEIVQATTTLSVAKQSNSKSGSSLPFDIFIAGLGGLIIGYGSSRLLKK